MQNIRVCDLLIGKINDENRILILTGKLKAKQEENEIFLLAVDLDQNEYELTMKPIFESYFATGGPFSEYITKDKTFLEVFANPKLMEILKKEKYDEISLTEIKALDILVKKTSNLCKTELETNNVM